VPCFPYSFGLSWDELNQVTQPARFMLTQLMPAPRDSHEYELENWSELPSGYSTAGGNSL